MITTPQYLLLFPEESRDGIYRRLQRLFHHGYLARLGSNPNAPMLYALDRRGADVLEVPLRRDAGDRYIAHQLMIGDFRIALTLATRAHGISFSWKSRSGELPISPDGVFQLKFPWLREGANRAHFFLEADRSTMTTRRFVEKLERYAAWYDEGGHSALLGIKNFRVLTITRSTERSKTLLAAVRQQGHLSGNLLRFWFGCEKAYTPKTPHMILGSFWRTGGAPDEPQSLIQGTIVRH